MSAEDPQFKMCPPPKEAPVDPTATKLGLVAGLRAELTPSMYRCDQCNEMVPSGSWQVWVPDSVRRNDPAWAVTEAVRLNSYNGSFSAWCLPCGKKLGHPNSKSNKSLIDRLIAWVNNE